MVIRITIEVTDPSNADQELDATVRRLLFYDAAEYLIEYGERTYQGRRAYIETENYL